MSSIADTAVFPMQDILGLDSGARMNRPSTRSGNWKWRLKPGYYKTAIIKRLRELTESSKRG